MWGWVAGQRDFFVNFHVLQEVIYEGSGVSISGYIEMLILMYFSKTYRYGSTMLLCSIRR